jgi:hypothetical protein
LEILDLKYLFYLAFIVLGYTKYRSTKDEKFLLFSLIGILDISTNLLNIYVFKSNLELLLVHNIISIGLYFKFFYSIEKNKYFKKIFISTFFLLSISFVIVFFLIDWPKSDISLYSVYGFLNTLEYLNFIFFSSAMCLIIFTILLIKMIKTDIVKLHLIFILFGIISYHVGELIQAGLGVHFLYDIDIHAEFTCNLLTIRLFTSNGLIITGLLWKN